MDKRTGEVFVRKSSGVVREVGIFTALFNNVGFVNLGLMMISVPVLTPSLFAGSDLVVATVIFTGAFLPQALLYAFFTASMPRAGGDYVWVSRVIGPSVGFAVNFVYVSVVFFATGILVWLMASLASTPLVIAGVFYQSPVSMSMVNWISSREGTLAFGTLLISFTFVVLALGMKFFVRFVQVCFLLGIMGTVVIYAILAVNSSSTLASVFNAFMTSNGFATNGYQAIISRARELGYVNPGFSWKSTLGALGVLVYTIWGYWASAYIGGELKSPARNALISIVGSFLVSTSATALLGAIVVHALGYDFLGSTGWLYFLYPSDLEMMFPPTAPTFSVLLYPSVLSSLAVGISCLAWVILLFPTVYLSVSRCIFAWSLDMILPPGLSRVWEPFHSPIAAVALTCGLGELFLMGYILAPGVFNVNIIVVSASVFAIVGLAGAYLPYRRKDLYDKSPIKIRLLGLPLMSWMGGAATVVWILVGYYMVSSSQAFGSDIAITMILVLSAYAAAFIIYSSRFVYLKRRGINLCLSMKEIPAE